MIENINEYISQTVDNLDKIIKYFMCQEHTREQEIAVQKLEEAVFWLTYGMVETDE